MQDGTGTSREFGTKAADDTQVVSTDRAYFLEIFEGELRNQAIMRLVLQMTSTLLTTDGKGEPYFDASSKMVSILRECILTGQMTELQEREIKSLQTVTSAFVSSFPVNSSPAGRIPETP